VAVDAALRGYDVFTEYVLAVVAVVLFFVFWGEW